MPTVIEVTATFHHCSHGATIHVLWGVFRGFPRNPPTPEEQYDMLKKFVKNPGDWKWLMWNGRSKYTPVPDPQVRKEEVNG